MHPLNRRDPAATTGHGSAYTCPRTTSTSETGTYVRLIDTFLFEQMSPMDDDTTPRRHATEESRRRKPPLPRAPKQRPPRIPVAMDEPMLISPAGKRRSASVLSTPCQASASSLGGTPNKRAKLAQFANFVSPKSIGKFMQRQLSVRGNMPSSRPKFESPAKRDQLNASMVSLPTACLRSDAWADTIKSPQRRRFSTVQIKQQESIHELLTSERETVCCLASLRHYRRALSEAGCFSPAELEMVFQNIDELASAHEELLTALSACRQPDGRYSNCGSTLRHWVLHRLPLYRRYAPGLVFAINQLDTKLRANARIMTVIEHCRQNVPSKMDLSSLLDVPRSKVVKYPLLFRNMIKHARNSDRNIDSTGVLEATELAEKLLADIDSRTGEASLDLLRSQLVWTGSENIHPAVASASCILCEGDVRNARGTKLRLVLLDTCVFLAHSKIRSNGAQVFQVYRGVIALEDMRLDNILEDMPLARNSFIRDIFHNAQTTQNCLRITDGSRLNHLIYLPDEHSKKRWLQQLQQRAVKFTTSL